MATKKPSPKKKPYKYRDPEKFNPPPSGRRPFKEPKPDKNGATVQTVYWGSGNFTAHGTLLLVGNLFRHLDGNVTIFSDVRDKKRGVPYMIDQLIKQEMENTHFHKRQRIRLLKAVKAFFE